MAKSGVVWAYQPLPLLAIKLENVVDTKGVKQSITGIKFMGARRRAEARIDIEEILPIVSNEAVHMGKVQLPVVQRHVPEIHGSLGVDYVPFIAVAQKQQAIITAGINL